jgi:hypothetical protein
MAAFSSEKAQTTASAFFALDSFLAESLESPQFSQVNNLA